MSVPTIPMSCMRWCWYAIACAALSFIPFIIFFALCKFRFFDTAPPSTSLYTFSLIAIEVLVFLILEQVIRYVQRVYTIGALSTRLFVLIPIGACIPILATMLYLTVQQPYPAAASLYVLLSVFGAIGLFFWAYRVRATIQRGHH